MFVDVFQSRSVKVGWGGLVSMQKAQKDVLLYRLVDK